MAQNCQTFLARVLQVMNGDLLVCSARTGQKILVHTCRACCFSVGDCVRIRFNGVMTMSIPPQITACCIRKANC